MECPKCHFALSPFDADCPRCKNFATLGIALPAPVAAQNTKADLGDVNTADNLIQAASPDTVGKPWYSQLDLSDQGLEDKGSDVVSRAVETKTATSPHLARKLVRTIPPLAITPAAIFIPRVPRRSIAQQDIQDAATTQMSPAETSSLGKSTSFLYGGIAVLGGLSLVVLLLLLIFEAGTTTRKPSPPANSMLSRASDLITQANATQTQFQQIDLTPEIAATSLHSRTMQYNESLRLCRGSHASGDEQMSLFIQQKAANGLKQVEADSSAQAARYLTAEVAKSIAQYKGAKLTNGQAASIRTSLRAKCQAALVDCDHSLHDDPTNSVALAERIHAFRHLGDEKSADSALARALILRPDNSILLREKSIHP